MIGTDDKSNISNYKYTNLVEICPLCKDDLLYLPAKTARNLGNISRLVLVKSISNLIHLIDPLTGQQAAMNNEAYWRDPIRPIITAARSRMDRFIVLGKEAVFLRKNISKRQPNRKMKSRLANLTLARESDLGINDKQYEETSYVGYLMKSGDVCVGYDLTETQFVDDEAEHARSDGKFPDVIVLRKLYGGVASNEVDAAKKRIWKLQRLDVEVAESMKSSKARKDAEADDMDEEDFMREVEADKDMRAQMNLYKSELLKKKSEAESMDEGNEEEKEQENDDDEDEDDQEIKLDELLDGLVLDSEPDKEEFDEDAFEEYLMEGEKAAKDGIKYVGREESRNVRDKDAAVATTTFSKEYSA